MILPRVKEESILGGVFRLGYQFSVSVDNRDIGRNIFQVFSLFFPSADVVLKDDADIEIRFCEACNSILEQYTIAISDKIRIHYGSYKALINALASLSQLAREQDGYSFDKCMITDHPDNSYRGILIDIARGVKPFDVLKADIITCAKAKYNIIQFHLNDNNGVCVRFDSIPESCYIEDSYTKEQLKELVKLCSLLGIEAVPEFDIPFHGKSFLTHMPQLRCIVPSLDRISLWGMCGGSEETYRFCESVIDEMCQIFTGEYFNMCCDEIEFADIPDWYYLCHWEECETCKALRQREGLRDRQEQVYYFMRRIYEMVKKHGKTPLMFSDQIDCTREDTLPKDIILWFWRIAAPGRGPHVGCTYEKQLGYGHKMINSACEYTYLEAVKWINAEKLSNWNLKEALTPELSRNVMGSVLSCWQYGCNAPGTIDYQLMYARGFDPAVYVFADRLWNDGHIPYQESAYSTALTKAVLGQKTPAMLDTYGKLADLIPYSQKIHEIVDKNTLSLEEAQEILTVLSAESQGNDAYANHAKVMAHVYKEAVEYLS